MLLCSVVYMCIVCVICGGLCAVWYVCMYVWSVCLCAVWYKCVFVITTCFCAMWPVFMCVFNVHRFVCSVVCVYMLMYTVVCLCMYAHIYSVCICFYLVWCMHVYICVSMCLFVRGVDSVSTWMCVCTPMRKHLSVFGGRGTCVYAVFISFLED